MNDVTRGVPPVIPGYRFVSELGRGGFADVYRYEQLALGRDVAVKVLFELGDTARARMRSEARLMARLSNHPHVVPLYEVGEADDGRPYLVMELCAPPDLAGRIAAHTLGLEETLTVGVQLAGAVATAHDLGILHLDLKPSNVLITAFGRPAITDFGIAATLDDVFLRACSPAWAAPEQLLGDDSPAADVYGLAATLWACVTGGPPPRPSTLPDATQARLPVPVAALEAVLLPGLDADPYARPTAAELGRALQGLQSARAQTLTPLDLAATARASLAPTVVAHPEHPTRYWPLPESPAALERPEPAATPMAPVAAALRDTGWTPASAPATGPAAPHDITATRKRRGVLVSLAAVLVVLAALLTVWLARPQAPLDPGRPTQAPTTPVSTPASVPPRTASALPATPSSKATATEIEINPGGGTFGGTP